MINFIDKGMSIELLSKKYFTQACLFLIIGLYGGYSACCESYSKSNVPGKKGFDNQKPFKTIGMIDCTNQYGNRKFVVIIMLTFKCLL